MTINNFIKNSMTINNFMDQIDNRRHWVENENG